MSKQRPARASLNEVAKAAGVSRAAASYALRNRAGVSEATRSRVFEMARRLDYHPDARMVSWMTQMQRTRTKDLLPIVWLNTIDEKDAWHKYKFHAPFIEGTRHRALELGYRLEEWWLNKKGVSVKEVNRILSQRGIEGIIVTPPARHLRLDWSRLAGVSLGGSLMAPRLHRVMSDIFYNLVLALKIVKRSGYKRIGICLTEHFDRGSDRTSRAAASYFYSSAPKACRIPPLFYRDDENQILAWLARHKPDAVICHSNRIVKCDEAAGFRVPKEVGVVHIATDEDVSDWAGITSNKREMGAAAAELVVSLINSRQFGVPQVAKATTIRGTWHPGRTLLIPKHG